MPSPKFSLEGYMSDESKFKQELENVRRSVYDSDEDWTIEFNMGNITKYIKDVLIDMLAEFVAMEVLSQGRCYDSPFGKTLGELTAEELQRIAKKEDLPQKYQEWLTVVAKRLILTVMHVQLSRFEDNNE